jgi:hypothetical protein
VAGRAAEERLVERGGEVLEVEHEDEGDEGQRERVRRQEGAPPPPVAVLRLPRSHRLGKQAEASLLLSTHPLLHRLSSCIARFARRRCGGDRDRLI